MTSKSALAEGTDKTSPSAALVQALALLGPTADAWVAIVKTRSWRKTVLILSRCSKHLDFE